MGAALQPYAYLGVLLFILLTTLPLELYLGVRVWRRPKRLLLTVLPVVVVFVIWDLYAIANDHWYFDPAQTTGVLLFGLLPIEELLFFVVVPVRRGHDAGGRAGRQDALGRGGRTMTYTQLALLGVLAVVVLDLAVLRVGLLRRRAFWTAYAIIAFFQLLTNGWLTGRRIVTYNPDTALTNSSVVPFGDWRIMYAPVEDLLFGFALIVLAMDLWIIWSRRGIEREPYADGPWVRRRDARRAADRDAGRTPAGTRGTPIAPRSTARRPHRRPAPAATSTSWRGGRTPGSRCAPPRPRCRRRAPGPPRCTAGTSGAAAGFPRRPAPTAAAPGRSGRPAGPAPPG
jgi:lycopene cyclase domain-containing protein